MAALEGPPLSAACHQAFPKKVAGANVAALEGPPIAAASHLAISKKVAVPNMAVLVNTSLINLGDS